MQIIQLFPISAIHLLEVDLSNVGCSIIEVTGIKKMTYTLRSVVQLNVPLAIFCYILFISSLFSFLLGDKSVHNLYDHYSESPPIRNGHIRNCNLQWDGKITHL